MVFTEIDKQTMRVLCTLVKLSQETNVEEEDIINVGQHLGVPKDDTIELFNEIEEFDTMNLNSYEDKKKFVKYCFEYMDHDFNPSKSELRLYNQVMNHLGLNSRSSN